MVGRAGQIHAHHSRKLRYNGRGNSKDAELQVKTLTLQ